MDKIGRPDPEGYVAFRGNSLMYADPTGAESIDMRGSLIINPDCAPEQRLSLLNAIGQAMRDKSECYSGLCVLGASFKRQLYWTLATSTYGCPHPEKEAEARQKYGVSFLSDGFILGEYSLVSAKGLTKRGVNEPIVLPPVAWLQPGPHDCIAQSVAHEASHKALHVQGGQPFWWPEDDTAMPKLDEESIITSTIDGCVKCR